MLKKSSLQSHSSHPPGLSNSCGRWLLYRALLVCRSRTTGQANQAGLSLLECLVAIAVTVLSLAIILPPLFVAAGSRVQSRRAEQAFQIAQAEVDRIQSLVERNAHVLPSLPPATTGPVASTPPPTGPIAALRSVKDCPTPYMGTQAQLGTVRNAVPVDIDGDCGADFFMQVFIADLQGVANPIEPTERPEAFRLGVRVYSVAANGNWGNMTDATPASLQFTSGFGQQSTRPLVALYPQIVSTNTSASLCDYHLNSTDANRPTACQ